jgi:hypothetical protein
LSHPIPARAPDPVPPNSAFHSAGPQGAHPGSWEEYLRDGTLSSRVACVDDRKTGERMYSLRNGIVKAIGQFVDDQTSGP